MPSPISEQHIVRSRVGFDVVQGKSLCTAQILIFWSITSSPNEVHIRGSSMGNKEPLCTQHPNAELFERAELNDKTWNSDWASISSQSQHPGPGVLAPLNMARMSAQMCGREETLSVSGRLRVHSSILPHGRGGWERGEIDWLIIAYCFQIGWPHSHINMAWLMAWTVINNNSKG